MEKLASQLLDPKTVSHAEMLGLNARFIVEGYMAGEHKSPFRGFAIEFAQHREYTAGDDTRHLDWKVLGRTDRYYIKQYEQETNYVAHLLVDGSESMQYGSGKITKLHYAKMMAACLAYLVILQRDAVSLTIFDQELRHYVPRSDNRATLMTIMEKLAAFEPKAKTNIADILHDAAIKVRRKGIVILISDCFDDEDKILDGIQHLRFCGHEVILFHVMDPHELEFPFRGLVEFIGLEQHPKILTRPNEIRKSYLAEVEAFRKRLREGCEKNRSHYVLVNTAHSLAEVLSGYLAFRARTTVK
ncbi:MAG: DUF58 domain-containing protein [Verrucomicrobiota bacterium]